MDIVHSDIGLLNALILGDELAFKHIYQRYNRKIFSFAFYLTKSSDIAEEIVQEVFLKVWEKKADIDPSRDFIPYIRTITQNLVFNFFKKAKREKALQDKISDGMEAIRNNDIDFIIGRELNKILEAAIQALPPQKRIIYSLSRNDSLSYDEIAQQLGLSRNTVRNHMHEAIKSVQDYVSNNTDMNLLVIAMLLAKK